MLDDKEVAMRVCTALLMSFLGMVLTAFAAEGTAHGAENVSAVRNIPA